MRAENSLSPKEYMKQRRPHAYSDSVIVESGELDRNYLEYLLSTLGERSQELNFETFAKKLCEKIICPNLLEQTGPVAGGDGKTDTQTFPVSEQIRELWFEGINKSVGDERWAFAVSTQKNWKAKCKKDIEKISNTARGYKRAFYISNRAVKSDVRAKLEDELSREYDIQVTILDISWILDQVFKNSLESLAINTLGLAVSYKREKLLGENDYSKELELKRIQDKIKNEVEPGNIHWNQVPLFIEVAKLSKELEEPMLTTQGYFDRAVSISKSYGTRTQHLEACYEYAWAAYFWFEDFGVFKGQFLKCINIIDDSTNSVEWEKIVNLFNLLSSSIRKSGETLDVDFGEIKSFILERLVSISEDDSRPSNALNAKIHIQILRFQEEDTDFDDVFKQLSNIIKEGRKLIGFPFSATARLLFELEDLFDDSEEYECLLDQINEVETDRTSEKQTARLLLKRGLKRLDKHNYYDSIKLIGKAMWRLYKDESREEFVQSCIFLSKAYGATGLFWSSRACMLFAASTVTDRFHKKSEIKPLMVITYWQLAWDELKIGRLGHSLKWFELARYIEGYLQDRVLSDDEINNYDGCVSHLICNCSLPELSEVKGLAGWLEKLELHFSYGCLIVALGAEKTFSEEFEVPVQEQLDLMLMVRDYVITEHEVKYQTVLGRRSALRTKVLGCEISVEFPNRSPFVEFAESLLSAIEGFLATGIVDGINILVPRVDMVISADDDDELVISHEFVKSENGYQIEITCSSFDCEYITGDLIGILSSWFKEFIVELVCKVCIVTKDNIEDTFESLMKDDEAFSRSFLFGTGLNSVYNIMGKDSYKNVLSCYSEREKKFDITRQTPWDDKHAKKFESKATKEYKPGSGDGKDIIKFDEIRHDQILTTNLIKPNLWDGAGWNAMGYICEPKSEPYLVLAYRDYPKGQAVFKDLYNELGEIDEYDSLRISIITGISISNPYNYRVVLSQNITDDPSAKLYQMISRILEMTPSTSQYLDMFRKAFQEFGKYKLTYGVISTDGLALPPDSYSMAISKKQIIFKEAWQVGENDIESVAINADDDLVVPDGLTDIPAYKVQDRKSKK
ncbi:hypothetical protein [Photobacterium damselae]|uniref:hypothetical protein n=1 Tax=Photobacterium damselae TaxID=38293 RepID=UPI000D8FF6A3|nr:hypothetical protein [Photobacterium damselae]NVO75865.1 hypothetical protein [Photobacterium damselae subsp. damselae]SPY24044.1 Uncharacterised protein [Photobacterium damselae]